VKAVRFVDGLPETVELDAPAEMPGEAIVRVRAAGICGTDLELARGYMDFDGVPGHEFVGIVERAEEPEWIGARVVGEINAACGTCETCRDGLGRHCPRRSVLGIVGRDGAFAELLRLPLVNLRRVPDSVPDRDAVFTEPLAAAFEILDQVTPPPGSRTLVLGDGRLGQLCAEVLALAGAAPLVSGHHPHKLARLERRGFAVTRAPDPAERRFDLVVEATGSPSGLREALALVRPRGTVVLKSTYHGECPVSLAGLVIDEVRLIGSRCGRFEPALAQLERDASVVEDMISAEYPLHEARQAFDHAARADALKVLLSF
jgi:threonine dehydrogenase-like Zn-dependent dehydrogenase